MNTLPIHSWQKELSCKIADLEQGSLRRKLCAHQGHIDFCSNDYLSLNANGTLERLLQECVHEWPGPGVGSTASRLLRGHYDAFSQLEDDFARHIASTSALFFSSGYAANTGTLPVVIAPRDMVFCDRLCHASLLDGIRLSQARRYYFRHNDLNDLADRLKRYKTKRNPRAQTWIVVESIYSMDGDSPDMDALCGLAERYSACIYLDEAHALGTHGKGGGLTQALGLRERIAVSVFPCGKAPGLMGAFVCGPKELKDLLINKARTFIYSTAPPPFLADLLGRVLGLIFSREMDPARKKLHSLGLYLRDRLNGMGFSSGASRSQIVPLIVGSPQRALALAKRCQDAGLDVRAIRPPSVAPGQSRLRLSLQAAHTQEEIEKLCQTIESESIYAL